MRSILNFLATPSNFLFLLIVLGLCLVFFRLRRLGLSSVFLGALGILIFGYSSAGELLMAPLVSRFPSAEIDVDHPPHGIIIMGAGINEVYADRTGTLMELDEDGDAVPIAALLARRFPEVRIVVSAGSGAGGPPVHLRQASGVRRVLMDFGVSADRIDVDPYSTSTFKRVENAIELIGDDTDKTWWVMTSAHRMPRVMGTFRQLGMQPVPYAVDYRWIAPFDIFYTYKLTDGLKMTDAAVKEWVGLLMYRLENKTASFFPAPG